MSTYGDKEVIKHEIEKIVKIVKWFEKETPTQEGKTYLPRTVEDDKLGGYSNLLHGIKTERGSKEENALLLNQHLQEVIYYFEKASAYHFYGDSYQFYKNFHLCLFSAFQLYAYKTDPYTNWKDPRNLLKRITNQVEREYLSSLFPPIKLEFSPLYRRKFIDWFVSVIEEIEEEEYDISFFLDSEKVEKILEHIHERDYLVNFRQLKGVKGVFRSPNPAKFIDRFDILLSFFKENNITDIIDLRGEKAFNEEMLSKDHQKKLGIIHHIVDFTGIDDIPRDPSSYVNKLKYLKERIKKVLTIIENAKGAVLFHCTTGKDRTGVVAAVIQKLMGVEEQVIIEDYIKTGFDAYPSRIKEVLKYIEEVGGITEYLESCGIDKEHQEALKKKLSPKS